MLLDVQNGKPFEVEAIVGEVVRMARERKVDIPVGVSFVHSVEVRLIYYPQRIEMLYSLLLVIQNQILRQLE